MSNTDIDLMLELKTWAVVGLSNNSERAAYKVSKLLMDKGHTVIPVHPKAETVHGQKGFSSLSDIKTPIDVVDIYVIPSNTGLVKSGMNLAGPPAKPKYSLVTDSDRVS